MKNVRQRIKFFTKFSNRRLRKIKVREIIIKNIRKAIIILLLALLLYFIFNDKLKVTDYELSFHNLPNGFDGFVIVQISDLHCKRFGKDQITLIQQIKAQSPEIIVITGDMFDNQRWNYDNIKDLLRGISQIAPVYAITGNHEYDDAQMFDTLIELYSQYGITLLNDEWSEINRGAEHINLYGMYFRDYLYISDQVINTRKNDFNVLLYHDPTQFPRILYHNFNLVLSGHTHGGVIKLPVLGGVFGTRGELFPKYVYGHYNEAGTSMIVSSGLGDTVIPRAFNRPEIVKITLKKG